MRCAGALLRAQMCAAPARRHHTPRGSAGEDRLASPYLCTCPGQPPLRGPPTSPGTPTSPCRPPSLQAGGGRLCPTRLGAGGDAGGRSCPSELRRLGRALLRGASALFPPLPADAVWKLLGKAAGPAGQQLSL